MTDNNDSPLDRLKQRSKKFLNNIGQSQDSSSGVLSESEKIKQERRKAREELVKQINPDALRDTGFEKSYSSLQSLRKQRDTDPIELSDQIAQANHENAIKLGLTGLLDAMALVKNKVVEEVKNLGSSTQTPTISEPIHTPKMEKASKKVEDSVQPPIQTPAPPSNALNVSDDILNRMTVLAKKMTGQESEISSNTSWGKLDKLSAQVRTAWVSVLSQGAAAQSSGHHWLNEWEKIVKDIGSSAENWPSQYKQTWKQWSTTTLEEIEHLRPWFSVATQNEVQIDTVLMVPSAFKNKGVVPSAPKSIPDDLVFHLQSCADYYEFISNKTGNFFWANTPAKHAFEEGRKNLENWKASTDPQLKWKEKALSRYSILEGRLTLKAVKNPPSTDGKKMTP